jgi:hypothetical protein
LAITPQRRYSADEKANILTTITRAQQLCPDRSLAAILTDLGLSPATYYRWQARAREQQLADRVVVPAHIALVCDGDVCHVKRGVILKAHNSLDVQISLEH